ncbi:MAG: hypothetical protein IT335_15870, partial [Thermomicrobiales bacterium]|nr:hypothetical protein [Thermomicrobiales bacterium]
VGIPQQTQGRPQFILWRLVHPNQQPTTLTIPASEVLDEVVDEPPAAEVEVADAEVGPLRDG